MMQPELQRAVYPTQIIAKKSTNASATGDVTGTPTVTAVSGDFCVVTISQGISASAAATCVLWEQQSTLNLPLPWVRPYRDRALKLCF